MRDFLMQAMGLVALGTVADVVPLVDENRVLVRHGLASLRERPGLGVAALMKLTELDEKPHLSSEDIAFTLAPRLNAAGRLGQATAGRRAADHRLGRAGRCAGRVSERAERQPREPGAEHLPGRQQAGQPNSSIPEDDAALVLADRGWHPGVIGIVAARLAEKFHRPGRADRVRRGRG